MKRRNRIAFVALVVLVVVAWWLWQSRRASAPARVKQTAGSSDESRPELVEGQERPFYRVVGTAKLAGTNAAPGDAVGATSRLSPAQTNVAVDAAVAAEIREVLSALNELYQPVGALDWNQAKALLAKREQATKELLERLARLGPGGARAMAEALLQVENLRAKLLLVQGMGKVNDPEAAAVLQSLLDREDSFSLRKAVVVALGQRRDGAAEQTLGSLLNGQSDPQLRFGSAQGLAGRENALPLLAQCLRTESNQDVRLELIRSIALVQSPEAMNILAETAESQGGELLARKMAIQELGRSFGAKALPALSRLLEDPAEAIRKSAVAAAARVKTNEAAALLQRTADSDASTAVSQAATAALASAQPGQ